MENKKLIDELNDLEINQHSIDWAENLTDDMWKDTFEGEYEEVASGLDVDTRRWYETSITVIKLNGGFIGVRHITNIFSESMMVSDCYHTMHFFGMKEHTITSYIEL